jgi:hypothetical protein
VTDDTSRIRESIEVDRITEELAHSFRETPAGAIEEGVRAEFERRHDVKVHDFVPIFVERAMRHKIREDR